MTGLNRNQSLTISDLQSSLVKSSLTYERQSMSLEKTLKKEREKMSKEREKNDVLILELAAEVEEMRAERTELQYETVETVDAKQLKLEKMR